MSSNPKIVVVKMREIIYTLLLIFLVLVLVICMVLMFSKKTGDQESAAGSSQTQSSGSAGQSETTLLDTEDGSGKAASETTLPDAGDSTGMTAGEGNPAVTSSTSGQNTAAGSPEPSKAVASGEAAQYTPGVYTASINLGESAVDVEVTVDQNQISGIRLVNLSEDVSASYPLVSPALEHIAAQILETQQLEGITCPSENRYTSQLLLSAIVQAVELAKN